MFFQNLLCERGKGARASRSKATEHCFMLHRSMSVVRLLDQLAEPRKKISVDDCEEEDMFMAFLICNVDSDTDRLLVCKMALILSVPAACFQ
ncbi:hypothetical protein LINGRAPRIM_LOCUS1571 [Linum grandiflorum]